MPSGSNLTGDLDLRKRLNLTMEIKCPTRGAQVLPRVQARREVRHDRPFFFTWHESTCHITRKNQHVAPNSQNQPDAQAQRAEHKTSKHPSAASAAKMFARANALPQDTTTANASPTEKNQRGGVKPAVSAPNNAAVV